MISIDAQNHNLKIIGLIGKPEINRAIGHTKISISMGDILRVKS